MSKNFHPVKRYIVSISARDKLSESDVNVKLQEAGFSNVNSSSYEMEKRKYTEAIFGNDSDYTLNEHFTKPRTISQL